MRLLLFGLAALLAAAPSAQNRTQMDRDMDARASMSEADRYRADLDRLGRDLDMARRSADPSMRADLDRLRSDYDALRTQADGDAMSDPAAAQRMRAERLMDLDRRVYQARLRSASDRDAYVRAATDRVDAYDRQIMDLRSRYRSASGDDRAMMAQDLIRLRRQRDAYRDEAYSTRGMLRSDFGGQRSSATSRLERYDTDFQSTYREASMRGMDGRMNDGM